MEITANIENKERYTNKKIQVLRAIAIFAVVMIHSNAGGIIEVLDRPFINFAVAMFIFLSGYLTKCSIVDFKTFYKKRILKVLIPYIIWTIVYTVVTGNAELIVELLITAKASAHLYYIFVYIQLVLLTPLVCKLLQSKYSWIGWIISPISVIFFRYICNWMGIMLGFPFPGTICLIWFIYYYLGMAIGNSLILYNLDYKKNIILYGIALILSEMEGLIWYWYGDFDMATTQLRLTSMTTSILAVLIAYRFITDDKLKINNKWLNKFLILVGDSSSGIFFLHMAVIMMLLRVPGYWYIIFPIRSVVILLVSIICVLGGKKILGQRLSRYLGL